MRHPHAAAGMSCCSSRPRPKRRIPDRTAAATGAVAAESKWQQPLQQGMRITVRNFTTRPGDAVITSVNGDGTLAVRYDDGGAWSRVSAADVTVYFGVARPEHFKSGEIVAPLRSRAERAKSTEAGEDPPRGYSFAPSTRYGAGIGKRKMCLTTAFVGTGCAGMQFQLLKDEATGEPLPWEQQPDTIEKALLGALHAWGGISDDNHGAPSKINWTRSSRTDKGVHALGCTVGCKLIVSLEELASHGGHLSPESLATINGHLPSGVRIVDGYRVRKGFSAQAQAESRRYSYYLPLSALRGHPLPALQAILKEYEGSFQCINFMGHKGGVPAGAAGPETRGHKPTPKGGAELQAKVGTAIEQAMAAVAAAADDDASPAASVASGSDATDGTAPTAPPPEAPRTAAAGRAAHGGWGSWPLAHRADPRFVREIYAAEASLHVTKPGETPPPPPTAPPQQQQQQQQGGVEAVGGMEEAASGHHSRPEQWVQITIAGRSFVLHQIRKMVATALFVLWGQQYFPREAFRVAQRGVWNIKTPIVPGDFLVLEETMWREEWQQANQKTDGRGERAVADAQLARATAELERFRRQHVLPEIWSKAAVFATWLREAEERAAPTTAAATATADAAVIIPATMTAAADCGEDGGGGIVNSNSIWMTKVMAQDWPKLFTLNHAFEHALAALTGDSDPQGSYGEPSTKVVNGVLQPRNLSLELAVRLRLTPGPELRDAVGHAVELLQAQQEREMGDDNILLPRLFAPDDVDGLLAALQKAHLVAS